MPVGAIVFDLDGVLLDSELAWNEAKRELALERDGRWHDGAAHAMLGMSSVEWSRYMAEELGVDMEPAAISDAVVERLAARYREDLPLLPGAVGAVERLAARWPLGLASSSNREIIDLVLELSGLARHFAVVVSSEEVGRGKPAPDVYLAVVERLGIQPAHAVAVEDSANGIRAARAAGLRVIALPNPDFPPDAETLAEAAVVLHGLDELTSALVESLG